MSCGAVGILNIVSFLPLVAIFVLLPKLSPDGVHLFEILLAKGPVPDVIVAERALCGHC